MNQKYILWISVFILLLIPMSPALSAYQVGDTVADFTLYDAYGNLVSLYDYSGMIIAINFWGAG